MRAIALLVLCGLAGGPSWSSAPQRISIDYPEEGSIFPPEITAPTFLWRDGSGAEEWRIEVAPGLAARTRGPRLRVGPIDPDCVADTNRPPALTPRLAAAHSWKPDEALWTATKQRPAATVIISGYRGEELVSRGRVRIHTSADPVGAPIFYRDVPLMPTETQTGVIKPLALRALPLVKWRLRNLGQPASRVLMEDLPTCANCHSFSADGKALGLDLDGLQNNKGMYTLTPLGAETRIRRENVIQWSTEKGRLEGKVRVGFMSQVSPDGQYVVTTIDPAPKAEAALGNYYVANFVDYRFLQVFYPTRGILAWYSRQTGVLEPLPGADDPAFVQMCAVWSPEGRYLVFARARAKEPNPPGAAPARRANDPNENQIQYDLYRIPFEGGRGGKAEPVAGASANGMNNTFPKVSPDGRWMVFVQCRNGQLLRPDSQLYIVPAAGGTARRMRCNTPVMNSWHSFSPNGRWLVFSSKARSPYSQMYLTHIDAEGNDSPAVLIENTTAANRAVNLPEFVNLQGEEWRSLGGPMIDYFKGFNEALYLQKHGRYDEAAAEWKKVLEISPDDELAHGNMAATLMLAGRPKEAGPHFQAVKEIRAKKAQRR